MFANLGTFVISLFFRYISIRVKSINNVGVHDPHDPYKKSIISKRKKKKSIFLLWRTIHISELIDIIFKDNGYTPE